MGDVISTSLSHNKDARTVSVTSELNNNFRMDQGQVIKVYTIDEAANSVEGSSFQTVYDVRVYQQNGTAEIISRCKMLQPGFGGGINNFFEVVQTDPGPKAADETIGKELKRGHYVLVGYVSGYKQSGVILGTLPHNSKPAVAARPKKARGVHTEGEIQGLNFQITNDGELKLTFNGPKKDDGTLAKTDVGPTQIQIDKVGTITVSTNAKQKITIDRVTHHIRIDNGPTYIDMDQDGDKIDVVAKNVNVGTGGLQPQVVGDDMVEWLDKLVTEITMLYVPTGVGPSGTPVNTPKFKELAAQLKEKILSKKHKVEK